MDARLRAAVSWLAVAMFLTGCLPFLFSLWPSTYPYRTAQGPARADALGFELTDPKWKGRSPFPGLMTARR